MRDSFSSAGFRHMLRAGVSLGFMALPTVALAQDAPQADGAGLPDIVVTAQRRNERVQDVPISITAFGAEQLQARGITDISRLDKFTPGFNFGQSGLDQRPAIRGVRTENVAGNGDPTIGFYVDDIYQSRSVQAGQPFIDLQRVEVARGPQGTLFGRNTFGGAVSVVTAVPTKDFDYGGNFIAGNFNRFAGDGFINIPVSDTFGIRVAGSKERRDGYVKNIVVRNNDLFEKDSSFVRVTARYAPSDDLEVILRGNFWHEGGTGGQAFGYKPQGLLVDPTTGLRSLSGVLVPNVNTLPRDGIPDLNGFDLGTRVDPDPYTWQSQLPARTEIKQWAGSGQIRWQNDSIFVRSITSYQDFQYFSNSGSIVGTPVDETLQTRNSEAFSQEFQIGGAQSKPLQWIVGLYYFDDKIFDEFRSDRLNLNDGVNGGAFPTAVKVKSYAAYAQASYYVTEQLRLTGGGRYTIDKKDFDADNFNLVAGVPVRTSGLDASDKFKKFTWRLGADYFATPQNMLYANVSTGFRSGGFNGGAGTNPNIPATFQPETVTAYEIGSKNRFLNGMLQLNLAAFYNDFKDLQIQNQFLVNAVTLSAIRNAGAAYTYGLEADAIFKPVPELTLTATMSLMKSRYEEYVTGPPAGYSGSFLSLEGNRIPFTPKYKFTTGARYDLVIDGIGIIYPQIDAVFSGGYFNTDYNTVLDYQKAYQKLDLRLGWDSEDDRFGVELFVENVTDEAVKNRGVFGSQGLNANYEPPRFYGIRFRVRK
ncbi:TonB-dependent receptor [Sphingobium algorifonticola]|nr:TonB-dependent receptor [Sphingobium algorifonticola]